MSRRRLLAHLGVGTLSHIEETPWARIGDTPAKVAALSG